MMTQNLHANHKPDLRLLRFTAAGVEDADYERNRPWRAALEIAKQAVALDDLDEFLRGAAQVIRDSYDLDLVRICVKGSKQEDLLLSGWPPRELVDSGAGQTGPQMVKECSSQSRAFSSEGLMGQPQPLLAEKGGARRLTVPLYLRGRFLGLLAAETHRAGAIPPEQAAEIESLASMIASAFDKFKLAARARQSEEYLQAILRSAKDLAIVSTDPHGAIVTGSSGTGSILQLPTAEVLGRNILTLFTDKQFQRELAAYIDNNHTPALTHTRLPQISKNEKAYLDVSLQRMYGADTKPIGFLCIARDVTSHVLMQERLEMLSITDELTGLFNKRHFLTMLANEMKRCCRYHRTFSLCFFDLDGFKKYNDSSGHLQGDEALKGAAKVLLSLTRANVDTCYRYGGDEFAIIMPETPKAQAQTASERIHGQMLVIFNGKITASIGIAEYCDPLLGEDLVEKADRAMHHAKSQGGNRIVLAEAPEKPCERRIPGVFRINR